MILTGCRACLCRPQANPIISEDSGLPEAPTPAHCCKAMQVACAVQAQFQDSLSVQTAPEKPFNHSFTHSEYVWQTLAGYGFPGLWRNRGWAMCLTGGFPWGMDAEVVGATGCSICIDKDRSRPCTQTLFSGAPKSLQMVTAAMKLKDTCSLEEKL